MKSFRLSVLICLFASGLTAQAGEQELNLLNRLMTERTADSALFAPDFLEKVSIGRIRYMLGQIRHGVGDVQRIEATDNGYRIIYEEVYVPAEIHVNEDGLIAGLRLRPAVAISDDLEQALAKFKKLSGQASVLISKNGNVLHEYNADQPLAVGSAFKLSVLAALKSKIDTGTANWDDKIVVEDHLKSLPSGVLQAQPAGTELTLSEVATKMISISDNTATDMLINYLGREAVEAQAPARNRPFLKTREFFQLKGKEAEALAEEFLAGDEATKRKLLTQVAALPMPPPMLFIKVRNIAIEWFYTNEELCNTMSLVESLEETRQNDSGIVNPSPWQTISFKGGSEAGVLNLTYWLTSRTGDYYCVSATQNNEDGLAQNVFFAHVSALLNHLPVN